MKQAFKTIAKAILYLIGAVAIFFLIILLVIKVNSTEEPEPILDEKGNALPNGISMIKDTLINGATQRLTIRGHNKSNPVLLRVHGGPGKVEPPQAYRFNKTDLEEFFTVCYWDQRGVGPAFDGNIPEDSYTIDQIVADGLVVTEYLRSMFDNTKIYIEGTSTGSVVGALMVREKPEYYHAYIGVAQVTDNPASEILSYNYVLSEANKRKDTIAIRELSRIGSPPYETIEAGNKAVQVERFYVDKYSPKNTSSLSNMDIMKLIFLYDGWSMSYKFSLISNGMYSPSTPLLWPQFAEINMFNEMTEWPIPVYIMHGEYDHNTEFSISKAYFDSLKAPNKKFFPFINTGHSIHYNQPEKYREIYLKEILKK
ncbi:MAG: alpha/beta hydrolase [Cyclobacteriaceae bacterium]|uniref:alpha/beta hydrolase n=1 Tax=Fulvivirga sp. TaxID=1931237 RepID=UPI0032EB15C4